MEVSNEKHLDVVHVNKLIDAVSEVIISGHGSVTFEVLIQSGNIKMVSVNKKITFKVQD